jgi:hypothetical protein
MWAFSSSFSSSSPSAHISSFISNITPAVSASASQLHGLYFTQVRQVPYHHIVDIGRCASIPPSNCPCGHRLCYPATPCSRAAAANAPSLFAIVQYHLNQFAVKPSTTFPSFISHDQKQVRAVLIPPPRLHPTGAGAQRQRRRRGAGISPSAVAWPVARCRW